MSALTTIAYYIQKTSQYHFSIETEVKRDINLLARLAWHPFYLGQLAASALLTYLLKALLISRPPTHQHHHYLPQLTCCCCCCCCSPVAGWLAGYSSLSLSYKMLYTMRADLVCHSCHKVFGVDCGE